MNLLERILAERRKNIAPSTAQHSPRARFPHRFRAALRKPDINIIAEFKRASPSVGAIRADARVADVIPIYELAGACALSILTESKFFHGSLDDLREARALTTVPILRKDFVVAESQIDEAAFAGADAILLIVAALGDAELRRLRLYAEGELGLDAVVEVHTVEEMQRALDCGAKLIGVNNRDLRTFTTSLKVSEELAVFATVDVTLISESGISSAADIARLKQCGYDVFLIGESLMRADDPAALLRSLRTSRTRLKVCGVTNAADARLCGELGVDMVGLNFSPQSARCISPNEAREIIETVRPQFPALKFVSVFVNQAIDFVNHFALDGVQLHGDESPAFVRDVRAPFVIKALRVSPQFLSASATRYDCDAILLDGYSASARGGTGQSFDWSTASTVKSNVKRLILAGGLTSENVRDAIDTIAPFAIDVCSGVEDAPGRKNPQKLCRFVAALRK